MATFVYFGENTDFAEGLIKSLIEDGHSITQYFTNHHPTANNINLGMAMTTFKSMLRAEKEMNIPPVYLILGDMPFGEETELFEANLNLNHRIIRITASPSARVVVHAANNNVRAQFSILDSKLIEKIQDIIDNPYPCANDKPAFVTTVVLRNPTTRPSQLEQHQKRIDECNSPRVVYVLPIEDRITPSIFALLDLKQNSTPHFLDIADFVE
jgi:hypothetical protein